MKHDKLEVLSNIVGTFEKGNLSKGLNEKEKLYKVFKVYIETCDLKIRESEYGKVFRKKTCLKLLTEQGDLAITLDKESLEIIESRNISDFDKNIINILGLKYRGCLQPNINVFRFDSEREEETFVKDGIRTMLAVGYKLDNIMVANNKHEAYKSDVAFAMGIDYQKQSHTTKNSLLYLLNKPLMIIIPLWIAYWVFID